MEGPKRVIATFVPWMVSNVLLYEIAYMDHLRSVRILAFLALFLSVLFFALSYRAVAAGKKFPIKFGVNISASVTILAGFLYLFLSGWRP
jgi:hypothetical protein